MSKDRFSKHAAQYARYRPSYPEALYNFIFSHTQQRDCAWDCGTGNGQAAVEIAKKFNKVFATDISQQQLKNAPACPNIEYIHAPEAHSTLPANSIDLVTVAQAFHWFDFDAFHAEVKRVSRQNATIAIWGYDLIRTTNDAINETIRRFYIEIVGPYWDPERKYLDERYTSIPFPYSEIDCPSFQIDIQHDRDSFLHYMNTWSAVKRFEEDRAFSPIQLLHDELEKYWPSRIQLEFQLPVFLRLGTIT